ncbi:MAG TPA: hypothetical protein VGM03_08630 [Phycisphaerae bacterium]|jgi:hypothetical protein
MLRFFQTLDRRWIFLLMLLAVSIPLLLQRTYPEIPTRMVQNVFDFVEDLPSGSRVLMAWDYEPASEGELAPMAIAFVRHCCEKRHKLYFLTTWPAGPPMIAKSIAEIRTRYPQLVYGQDYVNLGYKAGDEGVIKVIVTDLKKYITTDHFLTDVNAIPMMKTISSVQDMDLILNVSAGRAGTKEWVQYVTTPFPKIKLAAGVTGVQAPLFYPYIPEQLIGLLGAIKGAAEYEAALAKRYPQFAAPKFNEGVRRMAPQLWAHLLVLLLIMAGNVIYLVERRRGRR